MSHQLAGRTVVVTAHRRAQELGAALERRGADIVHAPMLSTIPHVDDAQLVARTKDLLAAPPDIVVVTTGVGFRGWIEAADAADLELPLTEVLREARLVVRGPKARGALQAHGLHADWVAESETTAEIRDLLLSEGVVGQRVAVQHHGAGSDGLDEALTTAGADVCSLVVYRWGPPPDEEAAADGVRQVADGEVDAVLFTSAPAASVFVDRAEEMGRLDDVCAASERGLLVAAVGPVTAVPLETAGLLVRHPDRYRMGALVRLVVGELGERAELDVQTRAGLLRVLGRAAVLDGRTLALTPTGLALLRALAEAEGGVVSRATLLSELPGESTSEHAVEVAVARLRESMGHRDLVQTVVKRGYRLAVARS